MNGLYTIQIHNDTHCYLSRVCALMCELFKWMLFINLCRSKEYPLLNVYIPTDQPTQKWNSARDIEELDDVNYAPFEMLNLPSVV